MRVPPRCSVNTKTRVPSSWRRTSSMNWCEHSTSSSHRAIEREKAEEDTCSHASRASAGSEASEGLTSSA